MSTVKQKRAELVATTVIVVLALLTALVVGLYEPAPTGQPASPPSPSPGLPTPPH